MGKFTPRAAGIAALTLAGALALSPAAMASPEIQGPQISDSTHTVAPNPGGPSIYRYSGPNSIATALDHAQRNHNWGKTVIIASAATHADALAITPIADALNAPVLLSNPGESINAGVIAYLGSSHVHRVILVGGVSVFDANVVTQVSNVPGITRVDRIHGQDRYETAVEAAKYYHNVLRKPVKNVFLADGVGYPDALTAGAAATQKSGVVLLTNANNGGFVPKVTRDAVNAQGHLDWFKHAGIIAVGGPAQAAADRGDVTEGIGVDYDAAYVGADRYETATLVAEKFFSGAKDYVLASGWNFGEAVVAGAYASNVDGPLLLTANDKLVKTTANYLEANRSAADRVFMFGGPASLSKNVQDQLLALNWTW